MSASFATAVIPRLLCKKKKRSLSSQQLSEEKHEPCSITSEEGFKFLLLGEGDQEADLEKTEASYSRHASSTSKYVGLICIIKTFLHTLSRFLHSLEDLRFHVMCLPRPVEEAQEITQNFWISI